MTRTFLVVLVSSYVSFLLLSLVLEDGWSAIVRWLALTPNRVHVRPWSLGTMVLLHRDPLHLLFNGLALWSLGPHVERVLGSQRHALLLVVSAAGGSLLYTLSGLLLHPTVPALGASAAVLGVLCAFALLFPRAEIQFFFTARLAARHLPWLIMGVDLVLWLARIPIAVAAHLGGMVAAWAFLRRPWSPQARRDFRRLMDRILR